jgi:hypothetical protein
MWKVIPFYGKVDEIWKLSPKNRFDKSNHAIITKV